MSEDVNAVAEPQTKQDPEGQVKAPGGQTPDVNPSNGTEQVDELEGLKKNQEQILKEKKELAKKVKEMEAEREREKENQLKEKEDFKTLAEQLQEKLKELEPSKEKGEKYDAFFAAELDKELKGEPQSTRDMVEKINAPLDEKLELLRKLKADLGKGTNSPASSRPGTKVPEFDIEQYTGPDAQDKLLKLSFDNPELYKLVIAKLNNGG